MPRQISFDILHRPFLLFNNAWKQKINIVFVDSQNLRKNSDYTISGNNITFAIRIFDEQRIDINYII